MMPDTDPKRRKPAPESDNVCKVCGRPLDDHDWRPLGDTDKRPICPPKGVR